MAGVFFANGEEFLPSEVFVGKIDDRDLCYATAIAGELVLKAFLLTRGWSDDRCRREIRHDLEKGLAYVELAGLKNIPSELGYVIGVLNAYYPKHACDRFTSPIGDTGFPARARSVIADLFTLVRPHVEASGGR